MLPLGRGQKLIGQNLITGDTAIHNRRAALRRWGRGVVASLMEPDQYFQAGCHRRRQCYTQSGCRHRSDWTGQPEPEPALGPSLVQPSATVINCRPQDALSTLSNYQSLSTFCCPWIKTRRFSRFSSSLSSISSAVASAAWACWSSAFCCCCD